MALVDAVQSLDDLASGRAPSQRRVLLGLDGLDFAPQDGGEPMLHDAAAALELFVGCGGVVSNDAKARARHGLMAAAVCRAMVP